MNKKGISGFQEMFVFNSRLTLMKKNKKLFKKRNFKLIIKKKNVGVKFRKQKHVVEV